MGNLWDKDMSHPECDTVGKRSGELASASGAKNRWEKAVLGKPKKERV